MMDAEDPKYIPTGMRWGLSGVPVVAEGLPDLESLSRP